MEPSPVQMFEASGDDQLDNKENMTLRSLVGDPNRQTPLADHRFPRTISSPEKQATSMYTLETRYQPIPNQVLPRTTNEGILYRQSPLPIQPEQQTIMPTVFLEPKVISQPIFYSIVHTKTSSMIDEQPIPINKEPPSPTLYSITGHRRRPTVDLSVSNSEVPTSIINQSPTVYSLVGTPRLQNPTEEPTNQLLQTSPKLYSIINSPRLQNPVEEPPNQFLQPSPNLYSITGSPARTSRGVQVSTLDPIQPTPILYTIVGDTPAITDRSKGERPLKQPTNLMAYTVNNQGNTLKARQQEPIPKPSLYALVSKSNSPPQENRARSPVRKQPSPPPTTTFTTRPLSHSLERRPGPINEEMVSYPTIKTRRQSITKESKPPKAETTFIPFNEQEQRLRPHPNPDQIHRKPYTVLQDQPIQLRDYHSPYAYRTHKPYRERKYNNDPLPVVSNNYSERKARPPLSEPRYRSEKRYPYPSMKPTSLERYPVNTKPSSNLWDNGYQTQTDDDEEYEQRINKKKRSYKNKRPRAPWIPVW